MNTNPIGIFDSGLGGLSVWKDIQKLLPNEEFYYLADSRNAPYGDKSPEEILRLSIKNTEFLLNLNCKLIVVACNTATTNAIGYLREHYAVPFIGIEPAIKPAALHTKTGKVGVLATKGTLGSTLFHHTARNHAAGITIIDQIGTGLVPLIEEGKATSETTRKLLIKYLTPMLDAGVDQIVLGCTHYPFLMPLLKELLPANINVLDCGLAVARQTQKVLEEKQLLNSSPNPGLSHFYTNKSPDILKKMLKQLNAQGEAKFVDF
ncbi:glutamate racemase [Lentiprolixibacter aurantiacus]|uniref:Glutamate racemase n=1 Tax=Lentiprolixibacter aurantiacus TaxID=2993939 RepID=A0AAE3MKH8_9FLAO|nr:glutamate racemase [Lentiprolixibacter aurantiacus]MCX2719104.1 glutamate racemase [Lentiprolixibacter aurantiacus]